MALVLWLASLSPLLAQTTGRMVGQAQDATGQPVPGVTVTVASPSLQGSRSVATDASGEFHLAFLPPGTYGVKAELAGFKSVEIRDVRVELDRTATVRIRLEVAPVSETVEVTGASSAIDLTSAATGLNATADLTTRIPLERSFIAIARLAAGTLQDGVGPAFYGATGAENQYVIDGLNVTDTDRGVLRTELNFDFVDEVEVKTGGLPAEYGRTTGGILNVLTKSGGNEFHGSAFGFFAGGGLQSDDRTAPSRPADTTTVEDISARYDFGAELGGRIMRDRLWFFAAFNRVAENSDTTVVRELEAQGAPVVGAVVRGERRDNRFAGKLTWRAAASSTLALSVFGDPGRFTGPVSDIFGPPSTYQGTIDSGGTNTTLRYEGTFAPSLLVRALLGRHRDESAFGGEGTGSPRFDDFTVIPPASAGGIGVYRDMTSKRDVARLDVSKFAGSHEIKLGGDMEAVLGRQAIFVSGGDLVTQLGSAGGAFYNHFLFVDDRAPGFDPEDAATWVPSLPAISSPRTRNLSAYAQDAWRIRAGLTLSAGLRFERQDLKDRDGETALTVDNWAPRVSLAWDVKKNGRSKVYAAFGRYFESIPQRIQFRAFRGPSAVVSFNFDPTPGAFIPDPGAPVSSSIFGGFATPVDPGLKGQHVDEWLVGFEREVGSSLGLVVGAKAAWRRLGRAIEDVVAGNGDYFIGNPGEGQAATTGFLDGSSAPSPKARRNNHSLELTARKRFSRGWQVLASYVWTRLQGNYDGLYQRSTGQFNPNFNAAFDFGDYLVNASGPLTSESVHQAKLDGSYELSGRAAGLNLGVSTHWYSGLPQSALGYTFDFGALVYTLAPRGSVGRNPADFEVDLHLSYPIRVAKKARILVQADAFNLLDRQATVIFDQRYNLIPDGPCAGIPEGLCNGDGGLAARPGTLEPLGSIADPRQTATNPDYLTKANAFTGPRSLRLGVRFSF